jgi:hypothetical protein
MLFIGQNFSFQRSGGVQRRFVRYGESSFPHPTCFLAGLDYGWHNHNFDRFLNFKVLYKNIVGKHPLSFQLTGVWDLSFYNKRISVCGFADFWREDNLNFTDAAGNNLATPLTTRYFLFQNHNFGITLHSIFLPVRK